MSKKKVQNIDVPDVLGEIWKDVKDYEGWYQVSNKERVKSLQRTIYYSSGAVRLQNSKLLTLRVANGYLGLTLRKMNKNRTASLHRLMAECFIDNPENKPEVNHIDGNKLNNKLDNLEWVTKSENAKHAWDNGLCVKKIGESNIFSTLKESDVLEIRRIGKSVKQKIIAEKYGVSASLISAILLKKRWKHI